ncbi:DNA polymerase-3 subunit alpha [Paucibacter oligotrophus]|uniref:DNA polymerase III subunit alpha n=1 Tax=Roseateles oligotrophus TaxID=1769250 RepID=A0A840L1C4_9BURK|nr:DNA polymerase III subunit alpha [Roseateles oligotrophus]MBB4841706.1 DNA polymerase-3 subunit alpha [Roseateles oligotrophus]
MPFVHLRTHTEFSVVDGTLRTDDAAAAAAKDGQVALGLSDLANMFGAIKFYSACRKKGVKPILGADCWLEPEGSDKNPSRLLLLVQNKQGYLNLSELLSRAWIQNVQRNQACLKWEWLRELNEGLICLSGAQHGGLGAALLAGDKPRALDWARRFTDIFPNRFYIELQRAGLPGQEALVQASVPFAAELKLPVVATHPVQFLGEEDFEAHEARVCVAEGETLGNPKRIKRFVPGQYFRSQADMEALFADIPSAIANTLEIAKRCSISLVLGKPQLPNFPTPLLEDGVTPMPMEQYFRQLSFEGLEDRLQLLYPDAAKRDAERPRYVERLEFELNTIIKMGFPGYFLIVGDFIKWAKNNGCPVGPGRGSGAGSLVAYVLLITDLDPLQYNLLFERFLNPERVSMPDFDIDFCQGNRDRVIDYVKRKYGLPAVSQIATFGTMAAKAALRDIGRVLGMGYGQVDGIAKLIPAPPGKTVTLAQLPENFDPAKEKVIYARHEAPEINEREQQEEEVAELLKLAARVEGMVRNIGMHAGGVLIAPGKITDFCPQYQQPGSTSAVSQYDKDDVEAIGLVKFDFLGLATLTILELAKDFIVARYPDQKSFAFETIPLDDRRTYKLFSDGLTESVFQFESSGMQRMLKDAKPSRLEDLIALNALYRPGPMDLIPTFVARKHGKEVVEYPHPLTEPVLAETYGIMVYQEQVMQTAQVLGGYSLGGADMLRRAMGKKKAEEMAEHRAIFRKGAAVNGLDEAQADEVFDLMEKFAGYGFNKSHAAAYSLLAYHTGWLKVHFTAEFFAANMTIEMDDTDKLKVLLNDAKLFGIDFEPPNVNLGVHRFEPIMPGDGVFPHWVAPAAGAKPKRINYGLGAIKGTGKGAIDSIVAVREKGGPFKSFFDFCSRIDRKACNKRVVEALIKAGAFDSLESDRARLLASVARGYTHAETLEANADQGGLFDFGDSHASSTAEPDLVEAKPWSIKERLTLEKTAIGFYLSGHLFDQSGEEVRRMVKLRIANCSDIREPVMVAGIVSDLRIINGNRGRVAIFKLDDKSDQIECVANEELLNANKELLVDDELLILQGKVQMDRFSGGFRMNVQAVWDLAGARARYGKHFYVPVREHLPALQEVVQQWPAKQLTGENGTVRQGLRMITHHFLSGEQAGAEFKIELGEDSRFWPCDEALDRLAQITAQPALAAKPGQAARPAQAGGYIAFEAG